MSRTRGAAPLFLPRNAVEAIEAFCEVLAEKINITVPGRVMVKIDEYAKSRRMSRWGFLVQAAQEAIAHRA